jgi:hypothetical protein
MGLVLDEKSMVICGDHSARRAGHPHHPLGMKRDVTERPTVP